jgi:hypothetical protein
LEGSASLPYRIVAEQALARWRAAHAKMEATSPDSPEWQAAYLEEQLAKTDYQAAVEAARREHLPEPPPFPEDDAPTDLVRDVAPST